MKKNWKIIVGALFLVGGFGCAPSDAGAAVFGIVVGIALIAWWIINRKKITSSVKKNEAPIASPPVNNVNSQSIPQSSKPQVKYDILIPEKLDGASIAYRYSVPFTISNPDAALLAAKEERWQLTAKRVDQDIHLFSGETDLGVLSERADMVADWLRRGDPYMIILERVSDVASCKVMLIFYQDKQKKHAHREQTVTALTSYRGEAKQDVISCLCPGDELEIEEDFEKDNRVIISYSGDAIGNLPQKTANRFIDEGAALVVFDHSEDDDDSGSLTPFVRIYW